MVDINSIIEGTVKFRDGKKWKSRWCVMRKLSPVADCLHLQFYRDSKERYKNGQTKASLSLEHFLGIESGFTLDKESNTIAIICQDVIVILAFDTREILMQWQVKISNNLGDDIQYLILIASAATKTKIPSGPARLHIQNYRFCITTGIPPRLTGLWDIAHLRRYGVVENRFCFEGGSSSGKCEGFVVLITDYGEEISNSFKLASQGKLNSNSRHGDRKSSMLESPRKFNMSMKDSQSIRDDVSRAHASSINLKCDCSNNSFWPSQESRGMDSFIGCDSSSLVDDLESSDEMSHFSRKRPVNLERCMSCNSKKSIMPSMSRSSTITDTTQSLCYGSASFKGSTLENHHRMHLTASRPSTLDRISMRSQESCSNISEYSTPRQCYYSQQPQQQQQQQQPPQHPHNHQQYNTHGAPSTRTNSFSIPESQKPPQRSFVGSYENYDSPKILSPSNENQMENYDKPKSFKMYLDQNTKPPSGFTGEYANYDTPNIPKNVVCGCNGDSNVQSRILTDDMVKNDCTCHRVMSWADNWMPCRRGNGIENTGVPISRLVPAGHQIITNNSNVISHEPAKCKLNDMSTPVEDKSNLYASVDTTKKQMKRLADQQQYYQSKPIPIPHLSNLSHIQTMTPNANYANLDFEKSLEIYENAKEGLIREQKSIPSNQCNSYPQPDSLIVCDEKENENYLVMEVKNKPKTFPGYISMHPATSRVTVNSLEQKKDMMTLPSIQKQKRTMLLLEEKSHSNPNLNRPCLNITKELPPQIKDNEIRNRKLLLFKKSSSVDSFRYLESDELSPTNVTATLEDEPSLASITTYQEFIAAEVSTSQSDKIDSESSDTTTIKQHQHIKIVNVRHSENLSKQLNNRDSSSSNDSGVSTASNVPKDTAYNEFELPLINQIKRRKHHSLQNKSCVHASLIRRSKSFDPFGELSFQFQRGKNPNGSLPAPPKSNKCPSLGAIMMSTTPYIDSNSTSSGTSDMSDYIETLSLSSHSSNDLPEGLRGMKPTVNTLRPRSGKEYQNIDRSTITLVQQMPNQHNKSISSNSSSSSNPNYVNITPVPKNSESPSPGYQSSTSFQDEFVAIKES